MRSGRDVEVNLLVRMRWWIRLRVGLVRRGCSVCLESCFLCIWGCGMNGGI